ncbi:MAG: hypothetical protein ACJ8FY_16930 [Gemmataceae bacterium]
MPLIACPNCARSIDLPLEYLSIWVQCAQCAQQFLPLTGDRRASVLNELRSYDCLSCKIRFTSYVPFSANRPHCPACGTSDTLPTEFAMYVRPKEHEKPREVFNPVDPKPNAVVPQPARSYARFRFRTKTKDDRADYWIVALVIGVLLVFGGLILVLVSLLARGD